MDQGYVSLPDSHRQCKRGAKRVRDVEPSAQVEVTLTLRGPQLPELDTSKPAMSAADFARDYGADPDDVAKVKATLERFGLRVEELSRAARSVRASGTAAQMEDAFHPGLGIYDDHDQGEFRGREGTLRLPAELERIVTGVFGLDERRVARRVSGIPAAVETEAPVEAEAPEAPEAIGEPEAPAEPSGSAGRGLEPGQLEGRYSFPAGSGGGQKVGIAEFGGTYFPDDLKTFCAQHGLEVPQVNVVAVGVAPPSPEAVEQLPEAQREEVLEDSGEVMMDIEIVAGLCQGAEIFVYFAKWDEQGWIDLLNKAISGQPAAPCALSVSWGSAEDSGEWSQAALQEISQRLEAAAHMGITICAASGDDGSGDQMQDGRAHVNFPATSPFVLSVGGTMIEGAEDVVWWQRPGQRQGGGGATGGGVSVAFDRPTWQTVKVESLNVGGKDGRVAPDIAALAGPPYYDLVFRGRREPNGGTSAATPLWASLIVRLLHAGKPTNGQTFLAPLLYEQVQGQARGQATCTDVAKGDNASEPQPGKGYQAGPGYDAVSGWGVPDGGKLLASLP
jgi:kumamolisin